MVSPVRTWVHQTLKSDVALQAVINSRVWAQGAILTAQTARPYLVHHFGNATDEGMADEDSFSPTRQFLQVYIHCDQGDYGPVDEIMPLVRLALSNRATRPDELVHVQYLETSQDLQDDLLQTFFRYMRFQLILAR